MNRRTFLELLGAGGAAALVTAPGGGCAARPLEALRPWEGPPGSPGDGDPRLRLAAWALLAPNAHNKQPWLVDLRGDGIDLYVDPRRLLPETDPVSRQIMISQGTFLELLSIAAAHEGLLARIELFPSGIEPAGDVGQRPVAHVTLTPQRDLRKDELFPFIRQRHTNRRPYADPAPTDPEVAVLAASAEGAGIRFRCLRGTATLSRAAALMTEAMRIETATKRMHAETVAMLRFDDAEAERLRDGITLQNLGLTGLRLFVARSFVSRERAFSPDFLKRTVDATRTQAFSAPALGLLSTTDRSRADEVNVGRAFARLHLTATKLGLSLHPMSQVLEIESERTRFVAEVLGSPAEEPQMLFRLGRSAPTPHSPRRDVSALVQRAAG
ncbi:MAG: nitroreductase family protein [Acidobacteria bacterium]|nr:nitroreductase family protein [Acidobacteriota bacterium]